MAHRGFVAVQVAAALANVTRGAADLDVVVTGEARRKFIPPRHIGGGTRYCEVTLENTPHSVEVRPDSARKTAHVQPI